MRKSFTSRMLTVEAADHGRNATLAPRTPQRSRCSPGGSCRLGRGPDPPISERGALDPCSSIRKQGANALRARQNRLGRFLDRCQDFLDLPDAAGERLGRHLEIGVVRGPLVIAGEELGHAAQFRQFPPDAMQKLPGVAALSGRLGGTDVIENGAGNVEEVLVLLNLVGMLEEGAPPSRRGPGRRRGAPPLVPGSRLPLLGALRCG